MKSSALGKFPILAGTMLIPWIGAWVLDVDLDLGSTDTLPTGKVTPNVSDATLQGTVDARSTGRFGEKARARIVGGAGAWETDPGPYHFHSDAGLLSSTVATATASAIGETLNEPSPVNIGIDFFRLGRDAKTGKGRPAPASRVLEGRNWHVDASGVTQVAPWPASTPSSDVEVLDFDVENRVLNVSSDTIVWPGTVFTDSRFGTMTARDVEIFITPSHFRAKVYCASSPASRFQTVLRNQVREYAQVDYADLVRYRIKQVGVDGRLQLDAVDPNDGFPSTLPLSVWPGMAGFFADFSTGTDVLVEFIGRDPTKPIVRGFAPPTANDLAALVHVALAPLVDARFANIVNLLKTHTHGGVTTGAGTSGVTGTPIPDQDSTASKIARAQ